MDTEFFIALVIVLLASLYLLTRAYRAWQKLRAGGCGGNCACNKAKAKKESGIIPAGDLMIRFKHAKEKEGQIPTRR
jgi:hypothetical protein